MAIRLKDYQVQFHGGSDVGLVRENNEDAWLADPDYRYYVLCDGMGGHTAGEIAAQEAVNVFSLLARKKLNDQKKIVQEKKLQLVRELIQEVNSFVYKLAQRDRELRGMGTTLCCVLVSGKDLIIGHVGDSRVYLLRGQKLLQLTEDHSLVAELMELGELNLRQARDSSYKNIITRAIGAEAKVEASVQVLQTLPGDRILMCSDGLSDMLPLEELEKILLKKPSPKQAIDTLIERAIRNGGHDNITAILLGIEESNEPAHLS